ncbi:MAG: hypothetical protein HYX32_15385 [Actinobacteria bacterium]|nr:hypothetical protein [Actinomycetota bacterium]
MSTPQTNEPPAPARGARRRRWGPFALVVAPVLLAAACASGTSSQGATAASAPSGSSAPAGTAAAAKPCDTAANPAGFYTDAQLSGALGAKDDGMAGMDMSGSGGTMDPNGAGATATTKPEDMSGGLGEAGAARLMVKLNQMSDAEYDQWLESLNPSVKAGAPDDTGMGGRLGPQSWIPQTDSAACAQLASELDTAKQVAAKYPKASDAIADGYVRIAPYVPGIASHWMKFTIVDGKFDINNPEMLLYDGNDKDANLVGLSYYLRKPGGDEPTAGFAGGNAHYHRHEGLCVGPTGVIGDSTTSEENCKAMGGTKQDGSSGWMSHAWVVPGCESPWGVFSAQNPILDTPLVEGSGQGAPCSASQIKSRWDLSPAKQ